LSSLATPGSSAWLFEDTVSRSSNRLALERPKTSKPRVMRHTLSQISRHAVT